MKNHGSEGKKAVMQQPSSNGKAWILLSTGFAAIYILLGYSGNLIYYINDDPALISILKSGDFRIPFSNSILGKLAVTLYSLKQDLFWYDLVIVTGYFFGISRLFFLFDRYQKLSYFVSVQLLSIILLGFMPFQPHFTFLSLLLSVCALYPFVSDHWGKFSRSSKLTIAVSFLFLFFACMYRTSAVFSMVLCAIIIHSATTVYTSFKEGPQRVPKEYWKRSAILMGMVLFTLIMRSVDIYIVTNSAEHTRYRQYNRYRARFTDFQRFVYDKNLENRGISPNDFFLMRSFMGIDSYPLNLENLRELKPLPFWSKWRIQYGLRIFIKISKQPFSLLLYLIIFAGCLISIRARIISGICISLILAIAVYSSKMTYSICLPFLALGAIVSIPGIQSQFNVKNSQKKRGITFFYSLVFLFTIALTVIHQYATLNTRINYLKRAEPIWKFIEANNIEPVVYWTGAIPGGNQRMFVDIMKDVKRPDMHQIGGWGGSYPFRIKKLQKIYGRDIYKGLAQPGSFHLFPRHINKNNEIKHHFEAFAKEHGPWNTTTKIMFETNDTILFEIENKNSTRQKTQ